MARYMARPDWRERLRIIACALGLHAWRYRVRSYGFDRVCMRASCDSIERLPFKRRHARRYAKQAREV